MASNNSSSHGPDWKDVASAQVNYQAFTGVVFVVELTAWAGAKSADLVVSAHAYGRGARSQGARPLVSVSVSCRQQGYMGLEAAVMKAMYDLDVALYANDLVDLKS